MRARVDRAKMQPKVVRMRHLALRSASVCLDPTLKRLTSVFALAMNATVLDSLKDLFPVIDEFSRDWDSQQDWEAYSVPFFRRNQWFLGAVAILYLPVTFAARAFMQKRKPFDLVLPLRIWNLAMTLFSFLGMFFCAPILLSVISGEVPLFDLICSKWCYSIKGANVAAHWIFLFNISKIAEFTDTAFLVLRKKPLIFLHYYHHIITFLFCWYAHINSHFYNCSGYLFATMNYSVHFIMYGYYFCRSMQYKPPVDILITVAQIVQMVFGTSVLITTFYCERVNLLLNFFGLAIYVSFFILFVQVFHKRYIQKPPPSEAGKKEKEKKKKEQ